MYLIATRKVDELGRIVLPMELRKRYQMGPDTAVNIGVNSSGQIVLQRSNPYCRICGKEDDLMKFKEKDAYICACCAREIVI